MTFRYTTHASTIMKICLSLLLVTMCVAAFAQDKTDTDRREERLRQLDRNGDGLLAKGELSKPLWERVARYDTNGDGKLDAAEQEAAGLVAAQGKAGRRPGGAPAAFAVKSFTGSNGASLRYSLFVPDEREEGAKLPVVLCLHGRGGGTEAPLALARPAMLARHPCIIIAPGIDGAKERWAGSIRDTERHRVTMPELIEMLDAVIREHGGDAQRVYVTGQSMGGVGTWGLIAAHPDRFAAAVPVCGMWNAEDAAKMKSVPVWAFHGADDATVPVAGSRDMIAALKAAGASPNYTEYAGVGHGSWPRAYATDEMWDWMFAQTLKGSE